MICFVALILIRLLALCLGSKYPIHRIIETLNKSSGSYLEENWYVFDYADEITKAITETLEVDLSRKYIKLGDIKKILGATKKLKSATTFCETKKPSMPYPKRLRRFFIALVAAKAEC